VPLHVNPKRLYPQRPFGGVLTLSLTMSTLLGGVLGLTGCQVLPQSPPDALYEEVWERVATDFVDPKTNHQDWNGWRYRYQGRLATMEDAYVAIETMLASLNDDYSRFMPPKAMNEQLMHIDAHLFGVGLQISVKNKVLMVMSPIPDTPASRASLKAFDVITHINGQSTHGLAVEEAANRIRGPIHTSVTLRIKREGVG
jgi:carboxyl-terminal processing protease